MQKPDTTHHNEEDISTQAAEWLIVLDEDQSEDTLKQLQQWLAQSPKHRATFQRMQTLINNIESLGDEHLIDKNHSKKIIHHAITQQQKTISYFRRSLLSIAILGSALFFGVLQYAPINYWMADQRNGSQSWQNHTLEDSSQIKVSGKTAYNIDYTSTQRKITLLQGNILVDVAPDQQRPFIVQTQHGTVQALGTRFIVTQDQQNTIITMLESKTAVWSMLDPKQKVQLIAGQRLELNQNGFISSTPIQINAAIFEHAWQKHTLIANGDDLIDILDQLSLYYAGKISFDRQALSNIKVTATLPLDDIENVLQQLAHELNLNIQQPIPYLIMIEK